MNDKQKDIFIKAAQLGVACGLSSPVEWVVNADRSPFDWSDGLLDAFVEFYRGTASCPEEEEWLSELTVDNFNERIVKPHYEYYRKQWAEKHEVD